MTTRTPTDLAAEIIADVFDDCPETSKEIARALAKANLLRDGAGRTPGTVEVCIVCNAAEPEWIGCKGRDLTEGVFSDKVIFTQRCPIKRPIPATTPQAEENPQADTDQGPGPDAAGQSQVWKDSHIIKTGVTDDQVRAKAFLQELIKNEFGAISEYDDIFDVNALATLISTIRSQADAEATARERPKWLLSSDVGQGATFHMRERMECSWNYLALLVHEDDRREDVIVERPAAGHMGERYFVIPNYPLAAAIRQPETQATGEP